MRRGIKAVDQPIDESNVHLLGECDTVFLCIDGGPVKRSHPGDVHAPRMSCSSTAEWVFTVLSPAGPLWGQYERRRSCRIATTTLSHCIDFVDDDDIGEYERNAQMAELNALNATLAVIKWKKLRGFYNDLGKELDSMYVLDGNRLINRFGE